jgi:proteasome inhibitor subunit 1 (PI31)
MANPLETATILRLLQQLLPQSSTSPLPQPSDAIAALVHTIHTALEYRLIPGSTPSAPASAGGADARDDTASDAATAVERGGDDEAAPEARLPEGWNTRGEDSYPFEYRHEQSSMTFRVRVGRMGSRVQIDAMAAVCRFWKLPEIS